MKRPILLASLLVLGVAAAAPAFAGPRDGDRGGPALRGRAERFHGRLHRRDALRHRLRFLKSLGFTEEQKALAKSLREEAAPAREALREKVRAILAAAREGERTPEARAAVREQVKAAILAVAEQVSPQADRILASLTPEQSAKIAEVAERHGKDAEKASRRLATALLLGRGRGARHAGR